ncbi:hypothetical protein DFJ73DRAFT_761485 [Zopfochytrium polystomum]|nr:hypothetical protein DFJ73DRAFT_761485 [Zopfochytrium polystomum]
MAEFVEKKVPGSCWNAQAAKNRWGAIKTKYTETKKTTSETGYGLTPKDFQQGINSIEAKRESLCPYYSLLDTLYGNRENVTPTAVFVSGAPGITVRTLGNVSVGTEASTADLQGEPHNAEADSDTDDDGEELADEADSNTDTEAEARAAVRRQELEDRLRRELETEVRTLFRDNFETSIPSQLLRHEPDLALNEADSTRDHTADALSPLVSNPTVNEDLAGMASSVKVTTGGASSVAIALSKGSVAAAVASGHITISAVTPNAIASSSEATGSGPDGRDTETNARPTLAAAGMEPKKKKRKIAEELDDEHAEENVHVQDENMPDLEHTSSITSSPALIQQSKKKHSYQEERMSLQKQDLEARTKSDSDRLLLDKEDGQRRQQLEQAWLEFDQRCFVSQETRELRRLALEESREERLCEQEKRQSRQSCMIQLASMGKTVEEIESLMRGSGTSQLSLFDSAKLWITKPTTMCMTTLFELATFVILDPETEDQPSKQLSHSQIQAILPKLIEYVAVGKREDCLDHPIEVKNNGASADSEFSSKPTQRCAIATTSEPFQSDDCLLPDWALLEMAGGISVENSVTLDNIN